MKTPSKEEIKLSVEWKDQTDLILTNHHGDTYTSKSEELHDFISRAQDPSQSSTAAQQSVEVMTLEECRNKVATDRGLGDWDYLCLRYLENDTAFPSRKQWINSASDLAAELYASQYKLQAEEATQIAFETITDIARQRDILKAELEQVKAERDAMREALSDISKLPDLRFGDDYKTDGYALALENVHRIANKALQSTKQ